jgi:hypothetical protein
MLCVASSYLGSTVAGKRVVPQSLMWASQWLLVVTMVAVRSYSSCEAQECGSKPHLAGFQGMMGEKMEERRCKNRSGDSGMLLVNS